MNEMMNEREHTVDLRLQDLLMAYLRRWKLIVLCVLLGAMVAWGITFFCATRLYRASATVYVSNNATTENKDSVTSSDLSASIHLVKAYMVLSTSDAILEETAEQLGESYTAASLSGSVTTSQLEDTIIFSIDVVRQDPVEAAAIANALANVLPVEGPKYINGTSASVIDTAKPPAGYFAPNFTSSIVYGIVIGLVLSLLYVTITFVKDTRIKDENDLTDMFDLPILGRIPDFDDEITGTQYDHSADDAKGGDKA